MTLWIGEFGRIPVINANGGWDHFPGITSAAIGGARRQIHPQDDRIRT